MNALGHGVLLIAESFGSATREKKQKKNELETMGPVKADRKFNGGGVHVS